VEASEREERTAQRLLVLGRSTLYAQRPDVHTVTIYSKPDCHLCERAKQVITRCQQQVNFVVEEVDISQKPELFERDRNDIPVILLDGQGVARHVVRERKLLELLQ
jgi:glutaredoxin